MKDQIMSHPQQIDYIKTVRDRYPSNFKNSVVLEVGSLNISGTVRDLFKNCVYTGVDIGSGPGVDIICEGQKYNGPDRMYDTVISCECFEHNPFWLETFFNMWRMTKPGGLLVFTCGTTGRQEHGTVRSMPDCSPLTIQYGWEDYYKNLTEQDFRTPFNFDYLFDEHAFAVDLEVADLYFCGIKRTAL
jgi:SAM-dependent methyltransferase